MKRLAKWTRYECGSNLVGKLCIYGENISLCGNEKTYKTLCISAHPSVSLSKASVLLGFGFVHS